MTEVCFCGQSLQRSISKLRASFCWDPVSSLSLSYPLSLSSSPVRIHYNLLSDKKAKTPITGGKLNFQFLLGIILAVGLNRLQRKTFSQERWGRPHSFSLGMREQEKEAKHVMHSLENRLHNGVSCVDWPHRLMRNKGAISIPYLMAGAWKKSIRKSKQKQSLREVSPAFCRPCIMACLKRDNGRRC